MNTAAADPRDLAEKALAAIDKVLADKPERNGHDFSAAVHCLSDLRDVLIRERRDRSPGPEARDRPGRLNAAISIIVGGQYPIGSVPWRHIEDARASFATLLAEFQGIE